MSQTVDMILNSSVKPDFDFKQDNEFEPGSKGCSETAYVLINGYVIYFWITLLLVYIASILITFTYNNPVCIGF